MSVQALSCALSLRGASASEKLLLLVLANYADDKMSCWPSHRRLADDTSLSQRTVLTLLRSLEEKRIISRRERQREDGSRTSDVITMHFSGEVISPPPEIISPRGEADDQGVGKLFQGGGEMVSPLTTFEPSINHQFEPSPLVAQSAPPPKRGSKRVPQSWSPSERTLQSLAEEGFEPGDLERALTRMRDHEFQSARSDWDAAFRNWVRRDADHSPRKANVQRHPNQAKPSPREDRLGRMLSGAMAAADRYDDELDGRRAGSGNG